MVLLPNCRKQHHGIDRNSSTAELSAPTPSIEVRSLSLSLGSREILRDCRGLAWLGSVSAQSGHVDLRAWSLLGNFQFPCCRLIAVERPVRDVRRLVRNTAGSPPQVYRSCNPGDSIAIPELDARSPQSTSRRPRGWRRKAPPHWPAYCRARARMPPSVVSFAESEVGNSDFSPSIAFFSCLQHGISPGNLGTYQP